MKNNIDLETLNELVQSVSQLKSALENVGKPPEEVVYDDVDLRDKLKVSKRTTAYWREKGLLTFSKIGGKIFYKWSDILAFLKQNEVPAVKTNF